MRLTVPSGGDASELPGSFTDDVFWQLPARSCVLSILTSPVPVVPSFHANPSRRERRHTRSGNRITEEQVQLSRMDVELETAVDIEVRENLMFTLGHLDCDSQEFARVVDFAHSACTFDIPHRFTCNGHVNVAVQDILLRFYIQFWLGQYGSHQTTANREADAPVLWRLRT